MKIIKRTPAERNHLRARVLEENTCFILAIVISLTQVTSRGRGGFQSCCFKAKRVNTKSEMSRAAMSDILRKVKVHVSGSL